MDLALLIHPTLKLLPVDHNPASDAEGRKVGLLHQLISRGPGDVISLSCISVFMSICCVHTYIFQPFRTYVHRILPKTLCIEIAFIMQASPRSLHYRCSNHCSLGYRHRASLPDRCDGIRKASLSCLSPPFSLVMFVRFTVVSVAGCVSRRIPIFDG